MHSPGIANLEKNGSDDVKIYENPKTFRHEFEPGVGYEGRILTNETPSLFDKLFKRKAYYQKVDISIYDFDKEELIGAGETRWVRAGKLAQLRMAHSLRREELKAWELCKEYVGKDIPFSSAIEEGLIRNTSG